MKRVHHPYQLWEDFINGMWRKEENEDHFLKLAIDFTGNHVLYGEWMLKVIEKWPVSCEHNLTNTGMNRKAWIGHAAANLALNIPEHITRSAWMKLTNQQRKDANLVAKTVIEKWEKSYLV